MSAPWIPQTTQRIRTMTVKVIGAGLAGWGLYSGWKTARDRMAAPEPEEASENPEDKSDENKLE